MSVKVHEAFSIDSFQDRLLWWDDFLGDQLQDEWTSAGDAGGSAVVVDAQTGGIVRITCDGDTGDEWNLHWNNIRGLHVDKKATMEIRAKINSVTACDYRFKLQFDASNHVMFIFRPGFGYTTWHMWNRNAGAITDVDSLVAPDTDYHVFRIECFPTGQVHYYIDGVEVANSPVTTNIPDDAGDFLQPLLFVETTENAEKSFDVDYVVVRQEI